MRLLAYVPVQCEAHIINGQVTGGRITIDLRRRCNTAHVIRVETPNIPGSISIIEAGSGQMIAGPFAVFSQPERYFDGIDRITIDCGDADSEQVRRVVAGIRMNVEVA